MLSYTQGDLVHWFGTSLSAPIWASVVTLVSINVTCIALNVLN